MRPARLTTDRDPARPVHPNDDVNMGQSSNDMFPLRRAPGRRYDETIDVRRIAQGSRT
jgi:aspartate ammonia-lyase